MNVPELEQHCGSWVIVNRATGAAVFETFERATAEAVNQDVYEVVTAAHWLARFSQQARHERIRVACEKPVPYGC
jgi:hypothetical protein